MARTAKGKREPGARARPRPDLGSLIVKELERQGIGLDQLCRDAGDGPQVKVVCVAPTLRDSVERLGESARDQVVMVRIDEPTRKKLDAWVETGAVKSRSEAAALFIREGLGVRESELADLKEALEGVNEARARLRRRASRVLGTPPHLERRSAEEENEP
jgi:Arc/MetJ-type ribon-helix-helix transcriptional regulator